MRYLYCTYQTVRRRYGFVMVDDLNMPTKEAWGAERASADT